MRRNLSQCRHFPISRSTCLGRSACCPGRSEPPQSGTPESSCKKEGQSLDSSCHFFLFNLSSRRSEMALLWTLVYLLKELLFISSDCYVLFQWEEEQDHLGCAEEVLWVSLGRVCPFLICSLCLCRNVSHIFNSVSLRRSSRVCRGRFLP